MENDKESLKRSHSVWSNFKLTLLCLFAVIAFSALWVGLAFFGREDFSKAISIIMMVSGAVATLLSLALFHLFKR